MEKKYLYVGVVAITLLAFIYLVTGGYSMLKTKIFAYRTGGPMYKLTLHVVEPINPENRPLPRPIKVYVYSGYTKVAEKYVDKNGYVTFDLPAGEYMCKAISRSLPKQGSISLQLTSDTEKNLELWLVPCED